MFRTSVPLAAGIALLALAPAPALAAKGFHYGVTSAEVTSSSALVWARPDKAGRISVELATNKSFGRGLRTASVSAKSGSDLTVQHVFKRLKPDTVYWYRFSGKGSVRSDVGTFHTAPNASANVNVDFGWTGDADAQPAPGTSKPFFNTFQVYGRMARARNLFNINLGDTIYSDSEVPGAEALATTVQQKWAKYKQNLALKNLQRFREAGSVYNQWDDHEFQNDFSKAEFGDTIFQAGKTAFLDYMPATYKASSGLYRTFRWGKNVEAFFLDERSFRDAKAASQCINPTTNAPDNAPTAPATTRATFAAVDPEFAQPVSAACLAAINDPNRTFLGANQLATFENAIKRSTATWKVIVNEVPIQQFYALPYDRWEGYAAERTKLLTFLTQNVKNAVFLTTDVHANLVNDVRFQTLETGGVRDSGITEYTTGPVATGTFSREIDNTLGRPGSGDLITKAFLKPAPPAGVGMPCANTDVFSYGQVHATAKKFTVSLLGADGKEIKDVNGGACGPFTLTGK